MMKFTATQIAELIKGKVEGNASEIIEGFGKIEEAKKGDIAFLSNPKYEPYLYCSKASVIIVNATLQLKKPVENTLIRVEDAYRAFTILLQLYQKLQKKALKGIHKTAVIHPKTTIGKDVYIGPYTIIEQGVEIGEGTVLKGGSYVGNDSKIGTHCLIYSGVHIYHENHIGNRVTIHSGAVIGSDGFGFAHQADGTYDKIPQIGNVVLEDDVEVGANTTIDRATMGSTIIKKGTKLDNLIQIAHNVQVGEHSVIAALTGIAGSTKIGKNARFGGQTGIVGHVTIGDNVNIGSKSGVFRSIPDECNVVGTPAFDAQKYFRSYSHFRNLDTIVKRLEQIEKKLSEKE